MGTSHILYLYDDALTPARDDPSLRDALALDLGRAILALTLDPDYFTDADTQTNQPRRLTWTRIGSHGNALHWCDEVHNHDIRVYVWAGNCLRELGALDEPTQRAIRDVIERTLAIRPGGR
jgi:hypothetical protein